MREGHEPPPRPPKFAGNTCQRALARPGAPKAPSPRQGHPWARPLSHPRRPRRTHNPGRIPQRCPAAAPPRIYRRLHDCNKPPNSCMCKPGRDDRHGQAVPSYRRWAAPMGSSGTVPIGAARHGSTQAHAIIAACVRKRIVQLDQISKIPVVVGGSPCGPAAAGGRAAPIYLRAAAAGAARISWPVTWSSASCACGLPCRRRQPLRSRRRRASRQAAQAAAWWQNSRGRWCRPAASPGAGRSRMKPDEDG
jgi:hypothetical protein